MRFFFCSTISFVQVGHIFLLRPFEVFSRRADLGVQDGNKASE